MSKPTEHERTNQAAPSMQEMLQEQMQLHVELSQLRQELSDARQALGEARGAELQEANAKLLVAALRSDAIAATALSQLATLASSQHRDMLTGAPDRVLMQDRLDAAVASARRRGTRFAVLFIDFDGFREINTALGHAGGDEALRIGAQRLISVLRESDSISRHGGDEFVALVSDVTRPADAALVARKMLAALAEPATMGDHPLYLSASIGIAMFPEDGDDAHALIRHADEAMYRSKTSRPGEFAFYGDWVGSAAEIPSGPSRSPDNGVPSASPYNEASSRDDDLCEANARLMVAALQAQEREQQARQAQEQQMKLMAMVAHELRHPLTPLRLAAEMLVTQPNDSPAALARLQRIIDSQVMHMSRLIGDLLDGSRVCNGSLRLQRKTIDLQQVLGKAIMACRPLLQLRKQQLELQMPPGTTEFHGDPVRLAQIFSNLLDNASKYTPEGGRITLSLTTPQDAVMVTVADNGIGISPDALESIFQLFVQEERGLAFAQGGLGIGLAVVRELVHAHGGTIVVQSEGKNQGSTFIVTLPTVGTGGDALTD